MTRLILSVCLAASLLNGCASPEPALSPVKIYYLDPELGLLRRQANERLKFEDARGYLCQSQDALATLLMRVKACKK